MSITLLAQIFGLLGALSLILSSWQTERKKALLYISLDSFFYILQYALLGAFSGLYSNMVSFFRTIIFYHKDKNKSYQKIIVIFVILAYIFVGIYTYDSLVSIFPVVVSILYTIALWQDDVKIIRYSTMVLVLGWLIYNLSVGAYASSLIEFVILLSSIISIIKLEYLNKSQNTIDKENKQ